MTISDKQNDIFNDVTIAKFYRSKLKINSQLHIMCES